LEYGTASVEIQKDAVVAGDKVVLIDDLIATGGTALAACTLINGLGASVVEVAALIDLPDLNGSQKIQDTGVPVYCLLAYDGL
jgi:adenine phosphoribosyltransferase